MTVREAIWSIPAGSRLPVFAATLREDGSLVNLSGASTVDLIVARAGDIVLTALDIDVVNATEGKVEYSPATSDLTVAGQYHGWVKVNWSAGSTPEYFPSGGPFIVNVTPSPDTN